MNGASLCVTCPNRESGLCGSLLGSVFGELENRSEVRLAALRCGPAGEQIATRNQVSDDVFVLCAGWAFCYFQLSDGRRQILQFLLPGDIFSSVTIFEKAFYFSVKALTQVQLSAFARSEIRARCAASSSVQWAIAKACIAETHDAAELSTALGQLSAEERIAYLLLHLSRGSRREM